MKLSKNRGKFLTLEQELECGRAIQQVYSGEKDGAPIIRKDIEINEESRKKAKIAINTLVKNNTKLVCDMAHTYKRKNPLSLPIDELIQEGMVGLMKSIYKYDPTRGFKFSTMAYSWINQSMVRGSNNTARLVRLPENRVTELTKINRMTKDLKEKGFNNNEIDKIIKEKLKIKDKYYESVKDASYIPTSLNKVVSNNNSEGQKELIEFVNVDKEFDSTSEFVMTKEAKSELFWILNELPAIQRDIVISNFELDSSYESLSPRDVKRIHNLSTSQYNDLLSIAIGKLKEDLLSRNLNIEDFMLGNEQ